MTFEDIWKIVATAVASVGGIGVIITVIVKFCSNIIADKLSKKYDLKMNKKLEKFKTELNKKEYVSKTRFDAEFSIYRELCESFFEMFRNIDSLIPSGYSKVPADKEEFKKYQEECYKASYKAFITAKETLVKNAPFISEELYNNFLELANLTFLQLGAYDKRYDVLYLAPKEEKESFDRDDYKRAREITKKYEELMKKIRAYLAKLDVAE